MNVPAGLLNNGFFCPAELPSSLTLYRKKSLATAPLANPGPKSAKSAKAVALEESMFEPAGVVAKL